MRQVMMIAAGGLAREAMATASRISGIEVVGLLDDNSALWGSRVGGVLVSGPLHKVAAYPDASLLICAGKGTARRAIAQRLTSHGVGSDRFATLVDPSVEVRPSCQIGSGSIVLANVVLTCDVSMGEHVVAMPNVTLTHDNRVDDFATLCAGVVLGGGVRVGEAAYLGMGAMVRENVSIGRESVLGMGAALLTDLPAGETWTGVPARPMSGRGR